MTIRINNIEGLTAAENEALAANGIDCAGELWEAIASDPGFLTALDLPDDTTRRRFLESIARIAVDQAQAITKSRFASHIADFIVVMLILSSVGYVIWVKEVRSLFTRASLFVSGPQYIVAAPSGLLPFRPITISDVTLIDGTRPGAPARDIIGRYASEEIQQGMVIDPFKLSAGMRLSSLNGFRVFNVKLQATGVLAGIKPPARISILVVPRIKDQLSTPMVVDSYVLDFHEQADGMSAVVALPENCFTRLASILSQSELIALGPAYKDR